MWLNGVWAAICIWPLPPPSQWKFGSIFSAITTAINHPIVVHFVIFHPHSTAFSSCSNSSTNDVSDPKTSSSTIQFPFGTQVKDKSHAAEDENHQSFEWNFRIRNLNTCCCRCYFVLLLVRQSFLAYFECLPLSNWLFQSGEKSIYYSITFHLWTAKNKKTWRLSKVNLISLNGLDGWMDGWWFQRHCFSFTRNVVIPLSHLVVSFVVVIVNDLLFCSPKKRRRAMARQRKRRNKKQIKIHAKPYTVGFRCNCSNNSGKHAVIPVFVHKHTINE